VSGAAFTHAKSPILGFRLAPRGDAHSFARCRLLAVLQCEMDLIGAIMSAVANLVILIGEPCCILADSEMAAYHLWLVGFAVRCCRTECDSLSIG
jgi:hypothetical protein